MILNWIKENADWVFSGVGVSIVDIIRGCFLRKERKTESEVQQNISKNNVVLGKLKGDTNVFGNDNKIIICPDRKAANDKSNCESFFSRRFIILQQLLNDARCYNEKEFTVEYISGLLGFSNVSDLKSYVEGEIEPDDDIKQKFVDIFCVNREWMLYNQGEYPFASNINRSKVAGGYAMDILLKEKLSEIHEFIVVIGKYESRRSAIIIRHSLDYCYEVYPEIYNLDMPIGATGRSQLISFYRFLRESRKINKLCSLVYKATEEQFIELYKGSVAPMLARTYEIYSSFTENFLDLSELGFERDELWGEKSLIEIKRNIQWKLDEEDKINQSVDVARIKKNLSIEENEISRGAYFEFI